MATYQRNLLNLQVLFKKSADTLVPQVVKAQVVQPNCPDSTLERSTHRGRFVGEYPTLDPALG